MIRYLSFLIIVIFLSGCGGHQKSVSVHVENPGKGEELFSRVGCATCHSISGEKKYGPPLNSIFGKEVAVVRNGVVDTVKVDREYILRSLKDPGFEKVIDFRKRTMPALSLSQEEIECLVDYVISINKSQAEGSGAVK